jgi:hypothetical protein
MKTMEKKLKISRVEATPDGIVMVFAKEVPIQLPLASPTEPFEQAKALITQYKEVFEKKGTPQAFAYVYSYQILTEDEYIAAGRPTVGEYVKLTITKETESSE